MSQSFDVVVIGAGPGGYIAAIRAAQLGLATACIDEWKTADGKPAPGGTCTNVGCIPSKALLQSSENYEQVAHHFRRPRHQGKRVSVDVAQMLKRKDKVVRQNNDGILYLFRKNKITFFNGRGSLAGSGEGGYEIKFSGAREETITARHVIVATGSNPRPLPGVEFDNKLVLDNDGALAIPGVPKRLGVVGAGVIGLEMGSVWRRLGAEVQILEALPAFLGAADEQVAREAAKIFAKQGLAIQLGVQDLESDHEEVAVTVEYTDADGKAQSAAYDKLIVAIGRVPNTNGLDAQAVGLKLDERGFVAVDEECRTNLAERLGDRRRGARPDARAQGGRRRRCRRPAYRRAVWPRGFQHGAMGDLYEPRDRLGRQERAAAQGRRRPISCRALFRSWRTAVHARSAIRTASRKSSRMPRPIAFWACT